MKGLKNWIITHKLLSIILAVVILAGVTLAIVLPITLAHKHEFATTWAYDGESHWHACIGEDCNELQDKAAHAYDNACDADCNVCGAKRTPAAHVYDNACDANCNVCGAERTVEPHVYDDETDATCNVCGAGRTLPTRYQAKDEAEWNAAFDFAKMTQFSVTADNTTQKAIIARDGDVISFIGYVASDSGMAKNHEIYYVKDGDNYYEINWNASTEALYERKTIGKAGYEMMFKNVLSIIIGDLKFSDFTFDATSNKYSNADATITHTLTYVGGVLTKIEATAPNGNPTATEPVSSTITFEKNTIAVPSSHVFANTWTYDKENHWHVCTDNGCDVINDSKAHDFATWSVKTEADYGVNRVETSTCTVCTYKGERTIENSSLEYTGDFYMMIIDVLNISGRGVVVTGKVDRGTVKVGDKVSVGGYKNELTVRGIELNKESVQEAIYGDEIAILLGNDVSKDDIAKGQPLYAVGTLTQHTTFTAEIYLKTEEEGGRKTPILTGYRPSFKINGLSIDGVITLAEGVSMIRPGETATVTIVLNSATYLRGKLEFSATEGGKSVLTGTVLSVEHVYADGKTVCTDCGYDKAVVAPYDGNGNFKLDNVALTAGDNWFVIDITQEMIDAYSDELSGVFTVSNDSAALTLAVKAYNATGTEITNDAVKKGEMYFEGLTAGKYYVKITANEACAGSLSMTIAV